jgi:hypothetical protein
VVELDLCIEVGFGAGIVFGVGVGLKVGLGDVIGERDVSVKVGLSAGIAVGLSPVIEVTLGVCNEFWLMFGSGVDPGVDNESRLDVGVRVDGLSVGVGVGI